MIQSRSVMVASYYEKCCHHFLLWSSMHGAARPGVVETHSWHCAMNQHFFFCNCREKHAILSRFLFTIQHAVTQQRSVTLDTALLKYIYGSVFTIHHAVVLFPRAVLHLDLCIIPVPCIVGCPMNDGKGLAMLRIVGPCNRDAMCFAWSRNWIFFNCCYFESDGAIFEVSSLLGCCAEPTEVLEDHLASIFVSGSVRTIRFYGARNC